jgi:hypothetical protein
MEVMVVVDRQSKHVLTLAQTGAATKFSNNLESA